MATAKHVSYTPKFGRVLIERQVSEKVGSIYLPQAQQRRTAACVGKIVGLGETAGWIQQPVEGSDQLIHKQIFKIGDQVLFGRHAGAWLDETYSSFRDPKSGQAGMKSNDDGTLFICQDADILAVINDEPKETT
jgi:co-chaperonin GroES (HSP10)